MDSEDEEDEDVISEIEGMCLGTCCRNFTNIFGERSMRARSNVPEYKVQVLSGRSIVDPNDGLAPRSRRRLAPGVERWDENRLRPRQGNARYLEAHPDKDWLLWGNKEVQEADMDVLENAVEDLVLDSIESDDDSDGEFEVENIEGEKIGHGGRKFFVNWVGWNQLDWINAKDCFCPGIIEQFREVQRASMRAAELDGDWVEVETLRKLLEAAEKQSQNGGGPNPSRRGRDIKGRFVRKRDGDVEPIQWVLNARQEISDSDDEDS